MELTILSEGEVKKIENNEKSTYIKKKLASIMK